MNLSDSRLVVLRTFASNTLPRVFSNLRPPTSLPAFLAGAFIDGQRFTIGDISVPYFA